ncbi:hypothetical protein [Haloarcula sp. CGMCC 1.6347]|uniref:hypothetical protein n=1 Tax=Haloarcula sp. CGMCC 1.6347 TaxID=3111455 RepID=UPI00300F5E92
MIDSAPAWASQQVTLPLWAVLVLAAYSNRRIIEMLAKAKGGVPVGGRRDRADGDGGGSP